SPGYVSLATSLVQGDGYTGGPGSSADLARPPGYPAFLAAVFLTLGREAWKIVLAQQALGIVVCAALYWVGRQVGSPRLGLAAALIFSLMPNPALWSMVIVTEALFTALIVVGCACLVRYLVRGSSPALLGAGLGLGAGALVRPVGLVLLPVWVLLVFLRRRSGGPRRAIAGGVTLLVLAFLLTTLPWMMRNQRVWGVLTVSSIGNWNLGYYIASATLADADHIPLEEARERIPISSVPQPGDTAEYLRVLLAHPISFLKTYISGTFSTLFGYGRTNLQAILGEPYPVGDILGAQRAGGVSGAWVRFVQGLRDPDQLRGLASAAILISLPILAYFFAARGVLRLWRNGGTARILALVSLATIASLLLPVGQVGNARFRVPMEPFLALLAAGGILASGSSPESLPPTGTGLERLRDWARGRNSHRS
ncbi:MAG: glycosyltransferase family 39 protein, partial [Anaerolineales bacterium]|nr:glycosyltransferase family 39 protein [Anaerolineales bacterium]